MRTPWRKLIPLLERLDTRVVPAFISPPLVGPTSRVGPLPPGTIYAPLSPGIRYAPLSPGIRYARLGGGITFQAPRVSGVGFSHLVNVSPARSSNGIGAPVTNPGLVLNPIRDYSHGREPVVVGWEDGPGGGRFTNDLSIQLRQSSATLIQPFNAVPGAGATFGIAFV